MIPCNRLVSVFCFFYSLLLLSVLLNASSWWLFSLHNQTTQDHRRMIPQRKKHLFKSKHNPSKPGDNTNQKMSNYTLPTWMVDYLQWHNQVRQSLNESNWQNHKYLVARCNRDDPKCGGLADRLRPLPFLLQISAMTGRLLIFHWERPYNVDEFLAPVSFDWRLPSFVPRPRNVAVYTKVQQVPQLQQSSDRIVAIRLQAYKEAEKFFNRFKVHGDDADMDDVLAPLWRATFQPAPPIQQRLDLFYEQHNLTHATYFATHLRTLYASDTTTDEGSLLESVRNALACTSQLPGFFSPSETTVVVASDSPKAVQVAQELAPRHVVASTSAWLWQNNHTSLGRVIHLDRGARFLENPDPSRTKDDFPVDTYYPTFVDFYLLVGARCVAYDRGGFGRLASLLSANPSCQLDHRHHEC